MAFISISNLIFFLGIGILLTTGASGSMTAHVLNQAHLDRLHDETKDK
jgi:hypothetical protein